MAPGMRERLTAIFRPLAAIRHPRRSLQGKVMLVVLATALFAVTVAVTILLLTELRQSHRAWTSGLATEADFLALTTAPALASDDRESATHDLAALETRSEIAGAALYRTDGTLFAQYRRPGGVPLPQRAAVDAPGMNAGGERAELLRPIVQNGETIGFVYLRGEFDLSGRIGAFAGELGVVLIVSMAFALGLSGWLQRVVTEPMESIARVAREVVQQRDYRLRAPQVSEDEVAIVVTAFNRMLDEVQSRTHDLERANAALHDSEKLYRAIGESIEYGVWVCDAEARNIYASQSFLDLAGITQEECAEFGWGERLHPDDRDATIAAWKACVREGGTWYREHRFLGADGAYHPILAQGVPIRDDSGRITRWAGINLDISRLKRTEEALREADRRKDEFLATLAHELRNPLAPIRNAVKILELSTASERQKQWGREVIARQVNHMALLLDDLLDVSRITRGRLHLRKEFVNLQVVLNQAIEIARPLLDAKRHRLETRLLSGDLRLEADPLRLSQVLGNLLTNAAKYTDPGGDITLTAALDDGHLRLSVRDTGVGMSPELIPSLFTMFFQADSGPGRAEGGLGIGLALVKGLVELHGGQVTARSAGPGQGSEFTVSLPKSIVATGDSPAAADPASPVVVMARQRRKVLVADDNRDGADSMAMLLELAGYAVHVAYSGSEALTAAQRERPHAMLVDIGMPDMTGHEVARRVRAEAWGRDVVMIAVTGWGQPDDRRAALAAGFDDHLTKPFDTDTLQRVLSSRFSDAGNGDSSATGA